MQPVRAGQRRRADAEAEGAVPARKLENKEKINLDFIKLEFY